MAEKLTKNKPFWMQWRPDKRKTDRPFSLHRGTDVALFNSHFSSWNSDKSDVFRWPLSFGRGDEQETNRKRKEESFTSFHAKFAHAVKFYSMWECFAYARQMETRRNFIETKYSYNRILTYLTRDRNIIND